MVSVLAVVFQIYGLDFLFRKGLIWLSLAIVCEIPPTVRLFIFCCPLPSRSSLFHEIGAHMFGFER
jgi:hypothetical protein